MEKPTIMLDTQDGKHKLKFDRGSVIGTDYDEFEVTIPIICDKCNNKIFHTDNLTVSESNPREMGAETYYVNNMDDIFCNKCNSSIHVQVEISEYAHNFLFFAYEIENCEFSHVFDIEKLPS